MVLFNHMNTIDIQRGRLIQEFKVSQKPYTEIVTSFCGHRRRRIKILPFYIRDIKNRRLTCNRVSESPESGRGRLDHPTKVGSQATTYCPRIAATRSSKQHLTVQNSRRDLPTITLDHTG